MNSKVQIWHYLPKTWNAQAATDLYENVIFPALQRLRGKKRRYTILEDNDPTGYKSTAAKNKKAELNIVPMEFPKYSPDLNPCDYSLWQEVENRMGKQRAPRYETVDAFKARLRRTALSIPARVVGKIVADMKKRSQSVYDEIGGHIQRD